MTTLAPDDSVQRQEREALRDFDTLIEERVGVEIKVAGQLWPVPAELPWDADVILDGIEDIEGSSYVLMKAETDKLLTMVYGAETIAAWDEAGVGMTRRMAILKWTLQYLTQQTTSMVDDDDDDGGDTGN